MIDDDLYLQVRKRPLNKKELAKNDEDIIETSSNSLVVHETKLKVCVKLLPDGTFSSQMLIVRILPIHLL